MKARVLIIQLLMAFFSFQSWGGASPTLQCTLSKSIHGKIVAIEKLELSSDNSLTIHDPETQTYVAEIDDIKVEVVFWISPPKEFITSAGKPISAYFEDRSKLVLIHTFEYGLFEYVNVSKENPKVATSKYKLSCSPTQ